MAPNPPALGVPRGTGRSLRDQVEAIRTGDRVTGRWGGEAGAAGPVPVNR